MKNPNGYGSIIKLGGKRRKPFAVRITTGWNDEGKQQYIYLGYYHTRRDAMLALAEYNNNPYDLSGGKLTFDDIYKRLINERFPVNERTRDNSSYAGYRASHKWAENIQNKPFVDLKKKDLQDVIDNCPRSAATKKKIRVLFKAMYRYAIENDLATRDYSLYLTVDTYVRQTERKPFTLEEIDVLWENVHRLRFIKYILILIYTGMRPGEIVRIKTSDINLEERYMRGGIKTAASKNRIIPIHKKIMPFVEESINNGYEYLVVKESDKTKMSYDNFYRDNFRNVMEQLEMKHRPHDCRHTFATLMDNTNANKLAIKRILGHAAKDITDQVYTHKDIQSLVEAIDMLE